MYDVVVKKFTFAVSSRDELLVKLLSSPLRPTGEVDDTFSIFVFDL